MSASIIRQPIGTPIGGQFAVTTRPETGGELTPAPGGLAAPAGLDEPTRQLVDTLDRAGLNGTVTLSQFGSEGWARVEVALPSGHEMSVGVARTRRDSDGMLADSISAITVRVRAGEEIEDEQEIDVSSYGGRHGEVEIGEQVRQALVASSSRAEFNARFPDAEAKGCTLEWIGQENAPTGWRHIGDPRPQVDGARFEVRGSDVLVTVLDRDLEFELDGRTLSPKDDYVRALVAGDVSRRLGLTTGPFSVEGLGATIVDVIAAGKRRPVYRDNLRDLG